GSGSSPGWKRWQDSAERGTREDPLAAGASRPAHRRRGWTLLEHPERGVLPLDCRATLSGGGQHPFGEAGAGWRYADGPHRRPHAFRRRIRMVRGVLVRSDTVPLGPAHASLPTWRLHGRVALRTRHLDGHVSGRDPPACASPANRRRPLVGSILRPYSVRGIAD